MWRTPSGRPRSENRIVIWCSDSGNRDRKCHRGRAQVGPRVAFLSVNEVRELVGISNEKDGRVVPHHIPVAFLGVKLEGKPANVAFGVCRTQLAGYRLKSGDHPGLLAHFREDFDLGVPGDVAPHGERAVCAPAFGMDHALGDDRGGWDQSKAMDVFQTSHTFPTRSGPGFKVVFPGFQPEGVASAPLLLRTTWKA